MRFRMEVIRGHWWTAKGWFVMYEDDPDKMKMTLAYAKAMWPGGPHAYHIWTWR